MCHGKMITWTGLRVGLIYKDVKTMFLKVSNQDSYILLLLQPKMKLQEAQKLLVG